MSGSLGIPHLFAYNGVPTSAPIGALNPEAGDLVFDTENNKLYRKTSPKDDNSGYAQINDVADTITLVNSAHDAVAGVPIIADTTSAGFTVTLPASPTVGQSVEIYDAQGTWNTNNVTVARNGNLIAGLAENLLLDDNNASVVLIYVGGATGWQLIRRS